MSLQSPIAPARARLSRADLLRGSSWVLAAFVGSRLLVLLVLFLSKLMRGGDWPRSLSGAFDLQIVGLAAADEMPAIGQLPLYSLLVKMLAFVCRDGGAASILLAHLSLLGAGLLLNALVNIDYRDLRLNRAAAAFLMFNPLSFLVSQGGSESTLLLFALASFVAARQDRWVLASLCGVAAALTSTIGFMIALPLCIEAVTSQSRRGESWFGPVTKRAVLAAAAPFGVGLLMLVTSEDVATQWFGAFSSPAASTANVGGRGAFAARVFVVALSISAALLILAAVLRVRMSYLVFAGGLLVAAACTTALDAPAFLMINFPLAIALALLVARWESGYAVLFAPLVAALTVCTIVSAAGTWSSVRAYRYGTPIEFGQGGTSERYRVQGWSHTEERFTWTDGNSASLALRIARSDRALNLKLRMLAATTPSVSSQKIEVAVNGRPLAELEVDGDEKLYTVLIPVEVVRASEPLLNVQLRIPNPVSLVAADGSGDPRRLGIRVAQATITKAARSATLPATAQPTPSPGAITSDQ